MAAIGEVPWAAILIERLQMKVGGDPCCQPMKGLGPVESGLAQYVFRQSRPCVAQRPGDPNIIYPQIPTIISYII